MPSLFEDPAQWRARAEEARVIAGEIKDRDGQQAMLEIARRYDALAQRAERRIKMKRGG